MPNFGWELPPGVTPEMLEEQFTDRVFCLDCAVDVTNDSTSTACGECKEALCKDCSDETIGSYNREDDFMLYTTGMCSLCHENTHEEATG